MGISHYFEVKAYKKHIEELERYARILNTDIQNLSIRLNRANGYISDLEHTVNVYEERYGELEFGGK
jgi:chromosome segregation ATPase